MMEKFLMLFRLPMLDDEEEEEEEVSQPLTMFCSPFFVTFIRKIGE